MLDAPAMIGVNAPSYVRLGVGNDVSDHARQLATGIGEDPLLRESGAAEPIVRRLDPHHELTVPRRTPDGDEQGLNSVNHVRVPSGSGSAPFSDHRRHNPLGQEVQGGEQVLAVPGVKIGKRRRVELDLGEASVGAERHQALAGKLEKRFAHGGHAYAIVIGDPQGRDPTGIPRPGLREAASDRPV